MVNISQSASNLKKKNEIILVTIEPVLYIKEI